MVEAVARIVSRLSADPDIRSTLRSLAELVLEATASPSHTEDAKQPAPAFVEPPAESPEPPPAPESRREEAPPVAPAEEPARRGPLPTLTLGQGSNGPEGPSTPTRAEAEEDREGRDERELEWIPDRCRLKAEGVQWAVERRMKERQGVDLDELAAGDRALYERAQELPDCFLWVNHQAAELVGSDPLLARGLVEGYEVAARAAELLLQVEQGPTPDRTLLAEILKATAEAQSALRSLVAGAGNGWDADQTTLFHAVRRAAERHAVYIPRYMRMADPADPSRLPALSDRLRALATELEEARRQAKDQKRRFNKIRYLSRRIDEGEGGEEDWRSLAATIDLVVEAGTPPSATELREQLLPILDDLPELGDLPRNFEYVLREVDRFLGGRSGRQGTDEAADRGPIPEVAEVAELLRGRSIVFLSNVANPEARDALIRAFELSDIDWVITREHQSIEGFESHVARPEVALVLLPIKWSSHSFGDIKQFCERYDTPLVRLRAGYNPNQVAVQILAQCSEKLRLGRDGQGE